jgi:uncharacterized protein (DUF488 family)
VIIYTIGHGTRQTDDLVEILHGHGVARIVDIRRFPTSRLNPHLAREPLGRAVSAAGIAYEWWGAELGGRRSAQPRSRHVALRERAFRGYADHMDTPAFRDAIRRLMELATSQRVAVMCAETLWWRCHRRLVADTLTLRGADVVHLLDGAHTQPHVLTPGVRADAEGWPIYDVGATLKLPG